MKSFRVCVTVGLILLLSVLFNLDSSLAGTLNADLSPDGVLVLDADFTGDFECVPEGMTPSTTIAEFMGCASVRTEGWTAHLERQFGCAVGHTWEYIATAVGGRYVNGNCG